ncbi:MAG: GIY-YIG nuclease family protein [Clostridiaceae bacterium]|nr:GIY-YIG nuclease family protein [Eubacteriales bacterium]
MFYAYMLRMADGSLYTGYTNDIEKRLAAHNSGTASKYTRVRLPAALVYLEACSCKSEALRRERALKGLRKPQKEALVRGFEAGAPPASASEVSTTR